jgi:hypothetical protein
LSQETLTKTLLPEEQPNIKHVIKTTERDLMLLKRKALTLTLILSLLVSALAGTLLIQNATRTFNVQAETANSDLIIEGDTNANVTIQSPENKTYKENNVTLAFTIESGVPPMEYFDGSLFGLFLRYGCALDYDTSGLVDLIWNSNLLDKFPNNPPLVLNGSENVYTGNATLTNLSQGAHTLTVWVRAEQFMLSYSWGVWAIFKTVSFNIDFTPPHISIVSPEPKVYNASDVPLDFTVNETASQITYSLDGQENITAAGNMTLPQLSNGAHNVTVYAADEAGNMGASETATFIVAKPEPFSLVPVAVASVTVVAVVIAGLLFYFKKRKH